MRSLTISISIHRLALVLVALLFAGLAQADLRVLIKFDEAGHRVHRRVSVEAANPAFANEQLSQHSVSQNPGKVSVVWIDAGGAILLSASMDDPRLIHAPLSSSESSPTLVALSEGAYMITGPSNSKILEIRLPANSALALAAQTWQFDLKP